jgi:digeranylgeranylglycerophospholipid reductase
MSSTTWDIVVVGAGPAGSSAAEAAARSGMRVLLVERRHRIGWPVRCAEYIPAKLLGVVDAGRSFVGRPVTGMKTFLAGCLIRETSAPGFMINRELFDAALAQKAREAGAEIRTGTSAVALNEGRLSVRTLSGRHETIEAGVIIGADGPHSRLGRWIGSKNSHLIPGIQVQARTAVELSFTEVHFSNEVHAGYGWVFPKGDTANVGLGMKPLSGGPTLIESLSRFAAELVKKGIVTDDFHGLTAGWIPAEPLRKFTAGNVYLAGDAAGHTHPITGAGVAQAVLGGRMAGEHAVRALASGDPTVGGYGYEEEWRDMYAESHDRAWRRRLLLEDRWTEMDTLIRRCWVAFREYYAGS